MSSPMIDLKGISSSPHFSEDPSFPNEVLIDSSSGSMGLLDCLCLEIYLLIYCTVSAFSNTSSDCCSDSLPNFLRRQVGFWKLETVPEKNGQCSVIVNLLIWAI